MYNNHNKQHVRASVEHSPQAGEEYSMLVYTGHYLVDVHSIYQEQCVAIVVAQSTGEESRGSEEGGKVFAQRARRRIYNYRLRLRDVFAVLVETRP